MAAAIILVSAFLLSIVPPAAAAPSRPGTAFPPVGTADVATAATQLAERYAPIFRLQDQPKACGPGEPYVPSSVDTVLGNPQVVLRGPAGQEILGPTVAEVAGKGPGWYLDLPGNPLAPGCGYERLSKAWNTGRSPVVYAHVATQADDPGHLALQYWVFYVFNDWNDLHEGDWEMIQVDFDASTASQALRRAPTETVYAQHAGGQVSPWADGTLQREGDHPVVYPAAGSHASYYSQSLWLGRSASEGFGCDDTRGPSRTVVPEVQVLPDDPGATSADAWLTFEGRWGQQLRSFNNGPTGPSTKEQWAEPFTWQESQRTSSIRVPGGVSVGPSATGVFCGAARIGSSVYTAVLDQPWVGWLLGAGVVLLLVSAVAVTRWRPKRMRPLRARRRLGQVLRVTSGLYRRHPVLLFGLGLPFVALAALAILESEVLPWLVLTFGGGTGGPLAHTNVGRSLLEGAAGLAATVVVAVTFAAVVIVAVGGTARALNELDEQGRPGGRDGPGGGNGGATRVSARRSLRSVASGWRAVLVASLEVAVPIVALAVTVVGIPWAARRLVRAVFVPMVIALEGLAPAAAIRRSKALATGRAWYLAVVMIVLYGITTVLGLAAGLAVLLFIRSAPVVLANVVASVLVLVGLAGGAVAATLVYFDALAGDGETPAT